MELDVASTTKKEGSYVDINFNKDAEFAATVNAVLAEPQNGENQLMVDIQSSMECKDDEPINKQSSGASPKLCDAKKITTDVAKHLGEESDKADKAGTNAISSDNKYFFEDEVFCVDKKGRVKFGLVMETSGDDDLEDALQKGEVRVVWYPKGNERVHSENCIGLADRTLMPGDVVKRLIPGKETQRGYCRDISMRADVKILGTKYVLKNINAERLVCVADWQNDSAVCLDSWVGSIKGVEKKAIIKASNGCRIEISSNDFFNFEDHNSLFSPHVFYAGNTVVGKLPHLDEINILTPDIPLNLNKKRRTMPRKFVVESVYTEYVWVHWQCKALSDETNLQSVSLQPHPCVSGEDLKRLKRLNLFESCMLQLNDRNYLICSSCDTLIKKSEWDREQALKYQPFFKQQKKEYQKAKWGNDATSIELPEVVDSGGGGGGGGATILSQHEKFEKFKKILSLALEEKSSVKSKRGIYKIDKYTNTNVKERGGQENVTNRTPASSSKKCDDEENEWVSTDGEDENDDDNDDNVPKSLKQHLKAVEEVVSNATTISTCSTPSPDNSPKHLSNNRHNKKKGRKATKTNETKDILDCTPKLGDEVITEAILVYSTATVIWQDGSIECNIPSTQLYPIHHLDNHEFFPGDFVISGREESGTNFRDYGVIQTVDHEGRLARVKWYTTYTSADEPKPTCKGESEYSVYDLKDHPDFQYRPGTMVIRVANFVGEDANCTAGQIIDNYVDGRVKVWWVDGHISMSWPQDLFEVGHYDQADWGHESEDSWETESENSEFGAVTSNSIKLSITESHILSNFERARVAIARLEEIFNISPTLQNTDVMRKLLTVYKGCRYFDRLLNTNFFHEDNFNGLIERVRRVGNQKLHERVQDQKNRLFNDNTPPITSPCSKQQPQQPQQYYQYSAIVAVNSCGQKQQQPTQYCQQMQSSGGQPPSKEYAPKVLFNISSTPFKCSGSNHSANSNLSSPSMGVKRRCSPATAARQSPVKKTNDDVPNGENCNKESSNCDSTPTEASTKIVIPHFELSPNKTKQYNVEKHQLLNSAMLSIEKAFEKTSQLKTYVDGNCLTTTGICNSSTSEDDSGNFSRNAYCDCSSTSCTSSSDLTNTETNNSMSKANDNPKSVSCSSIELSEDSAPELVCVRLCALLKEQLVNCIDSIREKYYKDSDQKMSELSNSDELDMEIVIDIESGPNEIFEENIEEGESETPKTTENENDKEMINTPVQEETSDLNADVDVDVDVATNVSFTPTVKHLHTSESFQIVTTAPKSHKFHLTSFHPNNTAQYYKAVQKEHRLLKNCLPPGVWVRSFEDRMDLLSVMIEGPEKTPYEDGMFFFDIQLGREYPKSPPLCHYVSYCTDRLNPNLYEDGKVCVSLLGTWTGSHTEVWGPKSTLLQVIVSIQGLILVPEPYFNEAGYEKQKGTQQGNENSRMYNEMVIIKVVQATTKLIGKPPEIFHQEIKSHFSRKGWGMYERIKGWMELSQANLNKDAEKEKDKEETNTNTYSHPEFSLVPASRGFCLTLNNLLEQFKQKLLTLHNGEANNLE